MPALLHPGRIIALAHGANPATWSVPVNEDYTVLAQNFLRLLQQREIPFVIVGGIALLRHVQGRNTEDIDLILPASRLADLPEVSIKEKDPMFGRGNFHSLDVDFLFAEHPVFEKIKNDHSELLDYEVGKLLTATIDGLVLLKLFALPSLYRQFDLDRVAIYEADILQLLSRSKQADRFFLDILSLYMTQTDIAQLALVLCEIRQKIERIKRKP